MSSAPTDPAVASLLSSLKSLELTDFNENMKEFVSERRSYELVQPLLVSLARTLQKQLGELDAAGRRFVSDAAVQCCHVLCDVPAANAVKYAELLYFLMFAVSKADDVMQFAAQFGDVLYQHVSQLSTAARDNASSCLTSVSNGSRLLLSCGRRRVQDCPSLASQLMTSGLRLCCLLVSDAVCDVSKLVATGVAVVEGVLQLPPSSTPLTSATQTAPPFHLIPSVLVQLSTAVNSRHSAGSCRLKLAAVRLAARLNFSLSGQLQLLSEAVIRSSSEAEQKSVSLVQLLLQAGSIEDENINDVIHDEVDSVLRIMTSSCDVTSQHNTQLVCVLEGWYTVYIITRLSLDLTVTSHKPMSRSFCSVVCAASVSLLQLYNNNNNTDNINSCGRGAQHLSHLLPVRLANVAHSLIVKTGGAPVRTLWQLHDMSSQLLLYVGSLIKQLEKEDDGNSSDTTWITNLLMMMCGNLYTLCGSGDVDLTVTSGQLFLRCAQFCIVHRRELCVSLLVRRAVHTASIQRHNTQHSSALSTLSHAAWLLLVLLPSTGDVEETADKSSTSSLTQQLMSAFMLAKRSARRADKQHTCVGVTMADLVASRGHVTRDVTVSLLYLEAKMSTELGSGRVVLMSAIIDQLTGVLGVKNVGELDVHTCWLLVARVRFSHVTSLSRAASLCQQAVDWLTSLTCGGVTHESLSIYWDICVAGWQKFICLKQLDIRQAATSKVNLDASSVNDPGSGEQQVDEEVDLDSACTLTVSGHDSINLTHEYDRVKSLITCLHVAQRIVQLKAVCCVRYSSDELMSTVEDIGRVLSGLGYSQQSLLAWTLLFQLAQLFNNHQTYMINAVVELSQRGAWEGLFEDHWSLDCLQSQSQSSQQQGHDDVNLTRIRDLLARAWRHYHRSQMEESVRVLSEVLNSEVLLVRWLDNAAVSSSAYHLASLLSSVPGTSTVSWCCHNNNNNSNSRVANTPLELAALACFYGRCLVHWSKSDNSIDISSRLYYCGLALDCTEYICGVYARLHCAREMRARCREHLAVTHEMTAALRLCVLVSVLVEADLLCEDCSAAQVHVHTVSRLLFHVSPAQEQQRDLDEVRTPGHGRTGSPVMVVCDTPPSSPVRQQRDNEQHQENNDEQRHLLESFGTPPCKELRWQRKLSRCASPITLPGVSRQLSYSDSTRDDDNKAERQGTGGRGVVELPGHPSRCRCCSCCEPRRLSACITASRHLAWLSSLLNDAGAAEEKARAAVHMATSAMCSNKAEQDTKTVSLLRQKLVEASLLKCHQMALLTLCDVQIRRARLHQANETLQQCCQLTVSHCHLQKQDDIVTMTEEILGRKVLLQNAISWNNDDCDDCDDNLLLMPAQSQDYTVLPPLSSPPFVSPPPVALSRRATKPEVIDTHEEADEVLSPVLTPAGQRAGRSLRRPAAPPRGKQKQHHVVMTTSNTTAVEVEGGGEEGTHSPPLVRRCRRRAAAVKKELENCSPPAPLPPANASRNNDQASRTRRRRAAP